MIRSVRVVTLALAVVALSAEAGAQVATAPRAGVPVRRQRMEQQLQQGLWRIAKQRVGLADEQMRKLEQVSVRYDGRRRTLNQEERSVRQTLRSELLTGERASQERVAGALDRLQQLQRQRLDLMTAEQKEFATFMTPVQRARYAAVQEQLRRRVDTMRRARPAGDSVRR